MIGVTQPTLLTLSTLYICINFSTTKTNKLNKKIKKLKITFFPCGTCLRRWISPLVHTALFSIIFKHPIRNQFSKTSDYVAFKTKTKMPTYLPYLFFMLCQSNFFFFRPNNNNNNAVLIYSALQYLKALCFVQ